MPESLPSHRQFMGGSGCRRPPASERRARQVRVEDCRPLAGMEWPEAVAGVEEGQLSVKAGSSRPSNGSLNDGRRLGAAAQVRQLDVSCRRHRSLIDPRRGGPLYLRTGRPPTQRWKTPCSAAAKADLCRLSPDANWNCRSVSDIRFTNLTSAKLPPARRSPTAPTTSVTEV